MREGGRRLLEQGAVRVAGPLLEGAGQEPLGAVRQPEGPSAGEEQQAEVPRLVQNWTCPFVLRVLPFEVSRYQSFFNH